jgi:predicted acetyltransferase
MIRQAQQDDIPQLAELWTRAFPGTRGVEDRIRHLETGGVFGGLDTTFVVERAGAVAGAFRAYPLTQHLHGAAYRMMGLAAVAVDETARRRGIGRELCAHAVDIARERGDVISMLYPFRPAFYHALGWGLAGELHAHRFAPEQLTTVRAGAVRRAVDDDASAIAACYARVASAANGLITRTPRIWRSHLQANGTNVYLTGVDRVRGYMIVNYGTAAGPDRRVLRIRELVAEEHEAYETLLGWVAAQRDAWRVVHYDAAPDERFVHRLSEPRPRGFSYARSLWAPVARVIRGPMLRVLDVPRAIAARERWSGSAPLRFALHVDDPLVPANAGPFVIEFDGRRAAVAEDAAVNAAGGAAGAAAVRPLLRLTAPAFAQVFAGELSVRDALNLGSAECDGDAAAIDALFRVDRCFRLLDEF